MSKYLTAAKDIQALSLQYQRVIDLGAFLGKLGSMENLEAEIQERVNAARGYEVAAREKLDATYAAIELAARDLEKSKADSDAAIKHGTAERARIIELAKHDAAQIIDEAKHDAAAIAEHAAKVKAEAVQLEADITAKIAEHKQWEDKIASLKAHVSDFIKG